MLYKNNKTISNTWDAFFHENYLDTDIPPYVVRHISNFMAVVLNHTTDFHILNINIKLRRKLFISTSGRNLAVHFLNELLNPLEPDSFP